MFIENRYEDAIASSVRSGMGVVGARRRVHAAPDGACVFLEHAHYKHVAPPGLRLIWPTRPYGGCYGSHFAATLLVLFPTSAWTRIVAPDLRPRANRFGFRHCFRGLADHIAALGGGGGGSARTRAGRAAERGGGSMLRPLRHAAH